MYVCLCVQRVRVHVPFCPPVLTQWAVFQPCPVPLASLAMPSSSSPTTSPSSPPPLPFSVFAPLATRVFEAALFLQEQNVLHRDFTLENLRVVEGQHSLTITNFGEAVVLVRARAFACPR